MKHLPLVTVLKFFVPRDDRIVEMERSDGVMNYAENDAENDGDADKVGRLNGFIGYPEDRFGNIGGVVDGFKGCVVVSADEL